MIVNVDVVGLEVVCAAFLAQDKVLIKELTDKEDIHSNNQKAFNLPSRLVAKVLKFRLLYGGSEFSFAKDPDFTPVSTSQKYWRKVIDRYYEKYSGIAAWHNGLLATVSRTKKLEMPTGRIYNFDLVKGFNGELKLPETTIKNYPVQGFGADICSILRVSFMRRFKEAGIDGKIILTVHDSIVVDCPEREVERVKQLFIEVFRDLPANISKIFGINFNLEIRCEVSVGKNQKELTEVYK